MAGLASVALILFVMLIPFFAFRNVSRELGRGRLEAMVFGGGADFAEPSLPSVGANGRGATRA